ncbi:type II secretion system major pseudopilin GspG [Phenylobacterium sp. LH3H17]|uniref:type II secretion system major pseudopilin GspG n=1 Tax=Phenylobacterium sp. LH3H17 TaxID=2903901 RepID=UPI0020C9EBA6|nr:type II secretion system major pseudopilin GspG [Phenylobacterium sp. LH3H17]UTP39757.1 type II secretion system major pseudopilin GspG [Phenylobacterium sp. LH3H17]
MRRNTERRRLDGQAGYTLTEILVVMAIIGLIAAILTPGLVGQLGRARAKTAKLQLDSIAAGVEMFRSDVGRYPTEAEGLRALINQPGDVDGWTGPYIKDGKVLDDPWGNDVDYKSEQAGRSFVVKSLGADGRADGSGLDRDITAP